MVMSQHVRHPNAQGDWHDVAYMCVSNGVTLVDATLMAAAPDLLALARKLASECAECGGSAEKVRSTGPAPEDEYAEPCAECADIWAVINKAEGKS